MRSSKFFSVVRASDKLLVADRVADASSIVSRMKGLLGKSSLGRGEGLLLSPCNSVHTWFMRFPIDVIYLSSDSQIVRIHRDMHPWKLDLPVLRAKKVLELASGAADSLREGEFLCIS